MSEPMNGGVVRFAKHVSIIGGALLVVSTLTSGVVAFFSKQISNVVVHNIVGAMADERRAREHGEALGATRDSLMLVRMGVTDSRVQSIAEALGHPLYSNAREDALDSATAPTRKIAKPVRVPK